MVNGIKFTLLEKRDHHILNGVGANVGVTNIKLSKPVPEIGLVLGMITTEKYTT